MATYSECPQGTSDDQLLIPPLHALGFEAKFVVWSDLRADWSAFDLVVLRSCWDYHLRTGEFLNWIAGLESRGIPLQNPAPVVRWNSDKRYLQELEQRGVSIPRTCWLKAGEQGSSRAILESYGWSRAVAKPTVSATAYRTRVVHAEDVEESLRGPLVIQEFMPEVQIDGEWSLVFFGGEYSHAIRKVPKSGDFRVQKEFGGRAETAVAKSNLIEQAGAVVAAVEPTLYARVDGVLRGSKFVLMELELIEPDLFLGLGKAAARFAQKIVALL